MTLEESKWKGIMCRVGEKSTQEGEKTDIYLIVVVRNVIQRF